MEIPVYTKYNIITFEMHARRKKMADIRSDASEVFHYDIPDYPMQYRKNHICAEWDFSDISIHWHDEIELTYVVSGSIRHQLNGSAITMHAGEGIFINSRQLHLIETNHEECELYCLIFHPTLLCSSNYIAEKYVSPIIENDEIPYIFLSEETAWQKKIFDRIVDMEGKLAQNNGTLRVMQNLYEIWETLYENIQFKPKEEPVNRGLSQVKQMMTYVQTNYQNKLTLMEICDAGMVGKTKGIQLFEQYLHLTPMEYVNHYRVEKAAYLLRETDWSITAIAYETGFAESSYFAKAFRKRIGMSPKEYRKEMAVRSQ